MGTTVVVLFPLPRPAPALLVPNSGRVYAASTSPCLPIGDVILGHVVNRKSQREPRQRRRRRRTRRCSRGEGSEEDKEDDKDDKGRRRRLLGRRGAEGDARQTTTIDGRPTTTRQEDKDRLLRRRLKGTNNPSVDSPTAKHICLTANHGNVDARVPRGHRLSGLEHRAVPDHSPTPPAHSGAPVLGTKGTERKHGLAERVAVYG